MTVKMYCVWHCKGWCVKKSGKLHFHIEYNTDGAQIPQYKDHQSRSSAELATLLYVVFRAVHCRKN